LLITQQITREYQQAEGFGDVAKEIGAKICGLKQISQAKKENIRKEKNAYNVPSSLAKNHQQPCAASWPNRLPAEDPQSIKGPRSG